MQKNPVDINLRFQALFNAKKNEEAKFEDRIQKLTLSMYSKELNAKLINFLYLTNTTITTVIPYMNKVGGQFNTNHSITMNQYDIASQILEEIIQSNPDDDLNCDKLVEFFKILNATKMDDVNVIKIQNLHNLMEQIYDSIVTINSGDIEFDKYLKPIINTKIISILENPFKHMNSSIHGVWEVIGSKPCQDKYKIGKSYLFGHCTSRHQACWPIIKNGLMLNKSSGGGRCGKGIYLSNDLSKCTQYSTIEQDMRIIFLVEVWLGRVQTVYTNGKYSATDEFDSVYAIGSVGPTMTTDIQFSDGTKSKVYVDSPDKPNSTNVTAFLNNEYVIYDENRCRLRYVILFSGKEKKHDYY